MTGAERHLGQNNGTDMSDLADLQTIRYVVSISLRSHSSRAKVISKGIDKKMQNSHQPPKEDPVETPTSDDSELY